MGLGVSLTLPAGLGCRRVWDQLVCQPNSSCRMMCVVALLLQ